MASSLLPLISQWYKDWFRADRLYNEWAHKRGLSYTSLFTLYVLSTTDGCTPSYICEFLSLSKQTVNSILGRLEKQGHIVREPSAEDKRSCIVRYTKAGKVYATQILDELSAMEHRAFGMLSHEELEVIVKLNGQLTDVIQAQMKEEDSHG